MPRPIDTISYLSIVKEKSLLFKGDMGMRGVPGIFSFASRMASLTLRHEPLVILNRLGVIGLTAERESHGVGVYEHEQDQE